MDKLKKEPLTAKVGILRNRVVERRQMLGSELAMNDKNWRGHPDEQKEALRSILTTIGMAGELLVYRSERNGGKLTLVDGHLRSTEFAGELWDVAITDLTDHEADVLLLAHDPLAAMAQADEEARKALLAEIDLETAALEAMLKDPEVAKKAALNTEDIRLEYSILISCGTEENQLAILSGLEEAGVDAKAICAGFPKTEVKPLKEAPKIEATGKIIKRSTQIKRTPRVKQLEGIFDVPASKRSEHEWHIDFALDKPWQIGLIVGPSGSGKTTLARELFGDHIISGWPWPKEKSIVDGFPAGMSIHDITGLLSSVGFSSPPSWLKPFHVLSNGEQFRVTLARTLAEAPELAIVDEFTSVVDRTVAQIGSHALAKTIRGSNRRFVAVACHYDIEDWLQPDWKYDTASGKFLWRSLRRRPEIQLQIRRVDSSCWKVFSRHHYLSANHSRSAHCFCAFLAERPVAFCSVIHFPHPKRSGWKEHRTVVLPDFQGIGIGNRLSDLIASAFVATGKPYRDITGHPAHCRYRLRSPLWIATRAGMMNAALGPAGDTGLASSRSFERSTISFEYVGPSNHELAKGFGLLK